MPMHLVEVGKNGARGIRCTQRMVILGVRDDGGEAA